VAQWRPQARRGLTVRAGLSPSRLRAALLLLAAAGLANLVGATLAVRGHSYVHLDHLIQDPVEFCALLVAPAFLAMACLMAATLPRIVTINIAVFLCLLVLGEAASWMLAMVRPATRGEPVAIGAPTFYQPDATLAYALAPSTVARHRRTVGDVPIYDVTYRTDERGRRETPTIKAPGRTSFLLFFGDSNTFGEGLSQTETIPYYAGEQAKTHRPYNYGIPGHGPAQLLALARLNRIRPEVPEREGYAIFLLIPAHVGRVVGSSRVSASWGRHFPYYGLADHGTLVSHGDFVHGRPLTTLAYFFWTNSHLISDVGAELPLWYTARDYSLTAKILKESSRLLSQQLHLHGFVVVLGAIHNAPQRRVMEALRDELAREGVTYLDYTTLFDTQDLAYRLSKFDYHNSAKANRIIAAQLVADLGISR
jgi:hypothetical protein